MDNDKSSAKKFDAKRQAYQSVFDSEKGKIVLKDLAEFCGINKDLFSSDPLVMAHNTGVRKVYLRIQGMLNITDQQVWELFDE